MLVSEATLGHRYFQSQERYRLAIATTLIQRASHVEGAAESIRVRSPGLIAQSNLACSYEALGRNEEALLLRQEVYSRHLKLHGEEYTKTLRAAYNYATALHASQRYGEVKSLMRKLMPMTRRILGESNDITLKNRWLYALALYRDKDATLNDLREAVATLESVAPLWKRVFGPSHPETPLVQNALEDAREALAARAA